MNKELDERLCKDFPLLFADRNASMRVTCMCWGFDVGDGWHKLIREAAEKLEPLIAAYYKENPCEVFPRASQVKEKFGTLRFYMTAETDEMSEIIREVESKSAKTCMNCGKKGILRRGGWLVVLCSKCHKKENE